METQIEKLKNMQTHLLIDVIKNYKQYGYPVELRDASIEILEQRGIKQQSLQLSGNFENNNFDEALEEYKKYNTTSTIALIIYVISILLWRSSPIISILLYIISLVFIALSFTNTKKISKILKEENLNYSGVFIVFSIVFYFILFFIVRKQVKDKVMLIR